MKVAVLYGKRDLRCEEAATPSPGPGEVLIRVQACAICGSDLHGYEGSHPRLVFPRIMGHEFAGAVEAVGPGVEDIKPGLRVCSDIDITCGHCGPCLENRQNLCENLKTLGFDRDGAYAEFVIVPAVNIYPLPENVSYDEASIVQTLGVGYHAVSHRANIAAGEKVAVIGAGPIGLGAAMVAKARGANVTIVDLLDYRLETALEAGIDAAVNSSRDDLKEKALALTNGKGFDRVLECVGGRQEKTVADAISIVKRGGMITIVGTFPGNSVTIPIAFLKDREINITFSRGNFQAFGPCLELISSGQIKAGLVISHRLPLSRVEEGFRLLREKNAQVHKVVLHPQEKA